MYQRAIRLAQTLNEFVLDFSTLERVVQLVDAHFSYNGATYDERRQRIIRDIDYLETLKLLSRRMKDGRYKVNNGTLKSLTVSESSRV